MTMNVNGVSFGSQDFNTLIAQPPASSPMAAAGMYYDEPDTFENSSSSFGKKVAIGIGIAAAVAGGLALLRGKVSTFKDIDLSSGIKNQDSFMGKVKYGIAKAGQTVIDGCKYVQSLWSKDVKRELALAKKAKIENEIKAQNKVLDGLNEQLANAADDAKKGIQSQIEDVKAVLKDKETALGEVQTKINELNAKLGKGSTDTPAEGAKPQDASTPPAEPATPAAPTTPTDTPAA